jgi:ubiquinone/menaquinone biosynthesis C-methylase UbiE
MIVMKEAIERHWSSDANNYNKSIKITLKSEETKRHWQEIFTEALGKGRLKVLDVGTGPGIVAFLLAELGHDVTGVDFSQGMISGLVMLKSCRLVITPLMLLSAGMSSGLSPTL